MTSLTLLEYSANAFFLSSVFLAARNNRHTWTLGIVGCVLFGVLFYQVQLYADATLMVFYIGTSVIGWQQWQRGGSAAEIQRTPWLQLELFSLAALATLVGYGYILHLNTDAYAPFADSAILAFSVLAQLLLMKRRIETWWFWLVVNTIAVPLYASRGLNLTAIVYVGFWLNACYGLWRWHRELRDECLSISEPV
ncbi:nicotinamide riboside transporter PnuC [Saccharospirillum impatiens]|uniref:nicotinamide riboside transporter PnuC n=1 Tax=Saccharospirillum impatiens TaxID=169438 RepID=UPI0003F4E128|nr:nicotinamide riboside transporter PnuC [Saccharospirillum impatiens]